ncbi:MAG: hydrolase, partial [Mucilaginibacter polytrichastri]|nr:hydrolase [Mucilaginibacter polytrichastri]
ELDSLSVGVNDGAVIRKPAKPGIDTTKRVVMYGSSILQGASASRPGMAYPAILSRRTGWEFVNLGFSGNAKMEIELAKYIVQVPANVYVLDCVPNPSPEQIAERAYPFIKYILDHKKSTPVVLVESVHREIAYWDETWKKRVADQNRLFRAAYERLKKEGYKNMYYVTSEGQAGTDHEAAIDGTHLTDMGFMRMADKVLPVIKQAMK